MSDISRAMSDLQFSDHFTDLGNVKYFLALYEGQVRFDITTGKWYMWKDHFWQEDDTEEIQKLIIASVEHRYESAQSIADEKFRARTRDWAMKSQNEGRITAIRRMLQRQPIIATPARMWNQEPALFAAANGIINLESGDFLDGSPEQMINHHSPISFQKGATAPRFEKFLGEIFENDTDLIYYMQKALGYSLTGMNQEQLLFFCHGSGSNGKTVLFTLLGDILGTYGVSVPSATFQRNIMNTQTNDLAMLQGKRFAMAAESLSATKMDEQKLKKISGGDEITARFLNKEFFSFRPICKIWLFMNHMPMFDDDSYSFWRRVRLIPFQRKFAGTEIDYQLIPKLRAELPGILNWLVDGARLWFAEGLSATPAAVTLATEDVRESNNRIVDFVGEWCEENEQSSEKASSLYTAYTRWSEQHNHQKRDILSQTMFGRLLSDKYKKIRTNEGIFYQGITLKIEYKIR